MNSVELCKVGLKLRSVTTRYLYACLLCCSLALPNAAMAAYPSIVNLDLTKKEYASDQFYWTINGQKIDDYGYERKDFDGDGIVDVPVLAGNYLVNGDTDACSSLYVIPSAQFDTNNLFDADIAKLVKFSNVEQLNPNYAQSDFVGSCYSSDVRIINDVNGDGIGDFVLTHFDYNSYNDFQYASYSALIFGSTSPGFSVDFSNPIASDIGIVQPKNTSVLALEDMNGDGIGELLSFTAADDVNEVSSVSISIHAGRSVWNDTVSTQASISDPNFAIIENLRVSDLRPLGDINGDGMAELALRLAETTALDAQSEWQIVYGSENLIPISNLHSSTLTLCSTENCTFQNLGDFNGDNFDDVLLVKEDGPISKAYIVYGSAEGLPA